MNKVVAILGIIVLLTLAMLFFCIGFFTGSTITPSSLAGMVSGDIKTAVAAATGVDLSAAATGANGGGTITADALAEQAKADAVKKLGEISDIKSATMSDKIMGILAAAGYTVENFSEIVKKNASTISKKKKQKAIAESHLTTDSLLREITASHTPQDDCSYQKTMASVNEKKTTVEKTLNGKKIVFIGYFKSVIAAQIQKLLMSKGYKTHVENAKSSNGHESFIFCGPFKKDETAYRLLQWLQAHEFSEARVISVTKEAIEETLYDAINDGNELPMNDENLPTSTAVPATTLTPVTPAMPTTAVTPVTPTYPTSNAAISTTTAPAAGVGMALATPRQQR